MMDKLAMKSLLIAFDNKYDYIILIFYIKNRIFSSKRYTISGYVYLIFIY
jgi:hypothetical protein